MIYINESVCMPLKAILWTICSQNCHCFTVNTMIEYSNNINNFFYQYVISFKEIIWPKIAEWEIDMLYNYLTNTHRFPAIPYSISSTRLAITPPCKIIVRITDIWYCWPIEKMTSNNLAIWQRTWVSTGYFYIKKNNTKIIDVQYVLYVWSNVSVWISCVILNQNMAAGFVQRFDTSIWLTHYII